MNSMTGFGRATQIVDGLQCIIEIKSVNSRFLDLNIRSPKQVNSVKFKTYWYQKDFIGSLKRYLYRQ